MFFLLGVNGTVLNTTTIQIHINGFHPWEEVLFSFLLTQCYKNSKLCQASFSPLNPCYYI